MQGNSRRVKPQPHKLALQFLFLNQVNLQHLIMQVRGMHSPANNIEC